MLTIIRLDRFFSEESRDHGLSRREEGKEEIEREREMPVILKWRRSTILGNVSVH